MKTLHKVYKQNHLNTKLFLQRKLYSIKYDEALKIRHFIQNVLGVVDQLRDIGKVIPESFDSLITILEARPLEEVSLEICVKSKLTATYEHHSETTKLSDEAAMKIIKGPKKKGRIS